LEDKRTFEYHVFRRRSTRDSLLSVNVHFDPTPYLSVEYKVDTRWMTKKKRMRNEDELLHFDVLQFPSFAFHAVHFKREAVSRISLLH
jgi:hypothetical protein